MNAQKKILVVDDEPQQLEIIVAYLENMHLALEVYRAFGTELALRVAQKELPDLIITDWDMPGADGLELVRRLKAVEATAYIPVIMCSGVMLSSDNLNQALEAGAVDYIRKPIDPIELVARTRSMLELSARIQEIKALNAEKDRFFGIVAHDLRNPFQALLGFSKLLASNYEKYDDAKRKHFIGALETSANAAYTYLENLLIWSRTQRGVMPFFPGAFDLVPLVEACLSGLDEQAKEKEIDFRWQAAEACPVWADREMVSGIIRNLLHNALKYSMPGSAVELRCGLDKDQAYLAVQDWGVGIEPELLPKLFRIDTHVVSPGTRKERGSGLGLIICNEFARINHGHIHVQSKPNQGSTFVLYLPQKPLD